MNPINVNLGEVQKTLLIPLFGRAEETQKKGIISDPKAVEIVERLDYDFSLIKGKPSLKGAALRTLAYDILLNELLERYETATVVELGCGLNTRYDRVGRSGITWFDLDMPDVYKLWQHFFEENDQRRFLPYSAFDKKWAEIVSQSAKPPYIFVSEASTIYFGEEDNKTLFAIISQFFPGSHYIFDTATDFFIENQDKHDVLKYFDARIKWRVNTPQEVEKWSEKYKLIKTVNFFRDPPQQLKKKIPWIYLVMVKLLGLFDRKRLDQYQLNLFRLD